MTGTVTDPRPTIDLDVSARRPRWQRVLIMLAITAVVLTVALYAGYRYLLTTEYGAFFTLFADDHRAENFRSMDGIFPSAGIAAADDTWAFERAAQDLPDTYRFEGADHDLAAFLDRTETTGLVVARDDTIVHEEYRNGYDETSQITSWSMAKSALSALTGIAVQDGHIGSLDNDVTDYVPQLTGSGYDGVTIRHLLTMSSGVDFDEDYDSTFADINMIFVRAFAFQQPMLDYYANLERERPPGTYNNYVSSDTGVLAVVLSNATGTPISSYLEEELWRPVGMEGDASWGMDRSDTEIGFCCLNARLRDYLRLGRLYLDDGMRDGQQILPDGWVEASTTPEAPHLEPGDNPDSFWTFGYGYKWWIPEDQQDGEYTAIGIWGQYIYVNPDRGVVIVKTGTDYHFDDHDHETIEAFRAIAEAMGR